MLSDIKEKLNPVERKSEPCNLCLHVSYPLSQMHQGFEKVQIWVCSKAGGGNTSPFNQHSYENEGLQGRKLQKVSFISSMKLSKKYSPIPKDQTHSLWHCLIDFTKELKPRTKACCLTLSAPTFPMSGGRWAGDNEIQRGEDGHAGRTHRWRSTSINGSKASSGRGLGKSRMSWDTTVTSSHHIPGLSLALLQVSNQTWFFHEAPPAQGSRSL